MAEEVRQPVSPQVRRRLQQQFQHGSKMIAAGNFDYAIDMFARCVLGDPGNVVYVQNLLSALQRKYSNTKKGSKLSLLQGMGGKTSMLNASRKKDWMAVFTAGIDLLQKNPFDPNTLTSLADACEQLDYEDSQVEFLKAAVQSNLKDAELNRLLARALESTGDFDGAIICWNRVRSANANDDEAKKGIGNCTVKRTIKSAKYEEAETSTEVMADKQAQAERMGAAGLQLTPEQTLERAISKKPDNVDNYVELADLHTRNERHAQAAEVLAKAANTPGFPGETRRSPRVGCLDANMSTTSCTDAANAFVSAILISRSACGWESSRSSRASLSRFLTDRSATNPSTRMEPSSSTTLTDESAAPASAWTTASTSDRVSGVAATDESSDSVEITNAVAEIANSTNTIDTAKIPFQRVPLACGVSTSEVPDPAGVAAAPPSCDASCLDSPPSSVLTLDPSDSSESPLASESLESVATS